MHKKLATAPIVSDLRVSEGTMCKFENAKLGYFASNATWLHYFCSMGIQRRTKTLEGILAAFGDNNVALSARMLLSRLDVGVNKTTVYRLLEKLEEDGVVHSFVGEDSTKFYARCHSCSDDNHRHSHPHFQCVSCDQVQCLDFEVPVPAPGNLKITDSQILLKGHCESCVE